MVRNSFRLFLFILIFSPLAFGSVEQWSLAAMEILSLTALFLFVLGRARKAGSTLREVPGIIPLLCLWSYHLLQVVPLPAGFVKIVSPETYAVYTGTIGISEPVTWISLSLKKKATLQEFFRFTSYGVFYVLTVQLLARKEFLRRSVITVIVFSSLLALFAILQSFFPNERVFWFRKLTQGGSPFGPFVNRNHYAGLMEMVFPVALSLFLALKPRTTYVSLREKVTDLLNRRESNAYILAGLAAIIIAVSVFLSLSRGGIVSLGLSMVLFGGMLFLTGTSRRRGIVLMILFILVVLSVGWFGWEPVFKRFERAIDPYGNIADLRPVIWGDSVAVIGEFPLLGTGFGNFLSAYPKYRTLTVEGIVDHAHNDYLELLAEGGIVAFALTAWFLSAVLYRSFRLFLRRKEAYSIYLFTGSVAGLAAILIHSLTDFNLHIGSNGLYFFFLAGLAVSAAHTRLRDGFDRTYLRRVPFPSVRSLRLPVFFLLAATVLWHGGSLIGWVSFSRIKEVRLDREIGTEALAEVRGKAYSASFFDPLEPEYRFAVGNIESVSSRSEKAILSYSQAVRLDPLNGERLQRLGIAYSSRDPEKAAGLLKAGISCERTNPLRYKTYASWLFSLGKKEEAMASVSRALSLSPEETPEYITFMVLNGLTEEEMVGALPRSAECYLAFGEYLSTIGKEGEAEKIYDDALHLIGEKKEAKSSHYYRIYRFYEKRDLFDRALAVMQEARAFLPEDAGIRYTAGTAYERLGMRHRAIEEYRKALILDPARLDAQSRLEALAKEKNVP